MKEHKCSMSVSIIEVLESVLALEYILLYILCTPYSIGLAILFFVTAQPSEMYPTVYQNEVMQCSTYTGRFEVLDFVLAFEYVWVFCSFVAIYCNKRCLQMVIN